MEFIKTSDQQQDLIPEDSTEGATILQYLPISELEMNVLAENGFDDVESFRFLNVDTLTQLKIANPEKVFQVVQMIINQAQEEEGEGDYEYDGEQHLGGEMEQEALKGDIEATGQQIQGEKYQVVNIEVRQPKVITQTLIVQTLQQQTAKLSSSAAEQQIKSMRGQNLVQTLQKLSHLHLNNKKITQIGEEMQQICKNLKVLYLFDNFIEKIDGLLNLKNLVQLSLYNNQITSMDGLQGLSGLRKLYIEKNRISRLEGLTESRNLEELYLSQQDSPVDFTFDEYSLAAIAGSLKYLDLSEAKVVYSQPLYYLEKLEVLILKKNFIADFEEQICPMLQTMNGLRQLDLSDNPVTSIPKYRDQVIILTGARLQEIDNKKVTPQERSYLMQLVQRKQRQVVGSGLGSHKEEKKRAEQFEIAGKNKQIHQATDVPPKSMIGTVASYGASEGDETQNKFYSPLQDDGGLKNPTIQRQKTNLSNPSFLNQAAQIKKRSLNINANNDFTAAGVSHMPTKHVPSSMLGTKK